MESEIQNRRDPATHFPRSQIRKAFGFFCDEVRRARLKPTERDLALLIAEDTLRAGFLSVVYHKLEDIVRDAADLPPLLNLERNDISPVLNALIDFGMVKAERVKFENNKIWLVLVNPNSAQWRMGDRDWRYSPDRLVRRRMHLNAQRRIAARYLTGLAPDIDLIDALANEAIRTCPGLNQDALDVSNQTADGRYVHSSANVDALTVYSPRERHPSDVRRSNIKNPNSPVNPAKPPQVPKVGTRLTVNREQTSETVQQFNRSVDAKRVKELMTQLTIQFERAHGKQDTAQEMSRSGGFWNKVARRFPDQLAGTTAEMKVKLDQQERFYNGAWFWAMNDLLRFIGVESWSQAWSLEKKKESLSHH